MTVRSAAFVLVGGLTACGVEHKVFDLDLHDSLMDR